MLRSQLLEFLYCGDVNALVRDCLMAFGGTALVAGMTMKQLGQVRGARKRLGQ